MNPREPAADVSASRSPPAFVEPVTVGDLRITPLLHDPEGRHGQTGGLLGATASDGTLQWSMTVYDNRRHPDIEGDAQDIFISELSLEADGRLLVVNEAGQRFLVDVAARTSTPIPSAPTDDDDILRP